LDTLPSLRAVFCALAQLSCVYFVLVGYLVVFCQRTIMLCYINVRHQHQ